ncbi:MAG: recombinase family protein [Limimaricola soesokkakensis]|uniref:recombinase family protein n=1 Tax=Limimaricola soesokkakensis TaxID=1343159 RepID=UPI004058A0AA
MALVGYARVSTDLQDTAAQRRELKAAGCTEIHEGFASGTEAGRIVRRGLPLVAAACCGP